MKRKPIFTLIIALFAFNFGGCAAKSKTSHAPIAQESKQAIAEMPSKEDMMKKWVEFSTPGPEHKELNRYIGKWNHVVKWWMDPSAPPEVSQGKSEFKWVFGGRYVEQTVKGKSMGQPFEGKGIMAFDKATNKYRSVWYDSMGTGLMIGSGTFDSQTNILNEAGSSSCPIKGTMPYRFVTTFTDKNHFRSEMYMENPTTGYEMKSMMIEYTRTK